MRLNAETIGFQKLNFTRRRRPRDHSVLIFRAGNAVKFDFRKAAGNKYGDRSDALILEFKGLGSKIGRSARVSRGLQPPSERVSCSERVCNPRLTKCGLRLWRSNPRNYGRN